MSGIIVNRDTCTKCGVCQSACLMGLIEISEDGFPESSPRFKLCSECGACITMCPTGSLENINIPREQIQTIDLSMSVNNEQISQFLKIRRSVRAYKGMPVKREDIITAIDTARYAPTGCNAQEVKWLVIDNQEKLKSIGKIGSEFMITAMKTLPNFADTVGLFENRKQSGYDIFLHSAPALVATYAEESTMSIALYDCTIALSYFDLAANSLGMGCCWLGFFPKAANEYPPIRELVELPKGYVIHACMAVGYPKYQHYRIPSRNLSDIIWH